MNKKTRRLTTIPLLLLAGVAPAIVATLRPPLEAAGYAPTTDVSSTVPPAVIVASRVGLDALPPWIVSGRSVVLLDDGAGADQRTSPAASLIRVSFPYTAEAVLDAVASAFASAVIPARRLIDRLVAQQSADAPERTLAMLLELAVQEARTQALDGGGALLLFDEANASWSCAVTCGLAHGGDHWLAANVSALPCLDVLRAGGAVVVGDLARDVGLAASELEMLRSTALVHDIGEIATSPEILERAGPLADWEWTLVRAHPRHGHVLLADVPAFQEALPSILHHHERWDGTGYPGGLAGADIPLGARIIAVADAWVALTTDRPYRHLLSPHDALLEIRRHARSQFDPAVVAALPQAIAAADPTARRAARSNARLLRP